MGEYQVSLVANCAPGEHYSQPHVPVRRNVLQTCLPAAQRERLRRAPGQQHSNRYGPRAARVITALLSSRAWPDSAFMLTYDEGGGLFDHQDPQALVSDSEYEP